MASISRFRCSLRAPRCPATVNLARCASTTTPQTKPLTSLLIANRGEIALRVNRTAAEHGIRTTTLYTHPDSLSQHALGSPFSINLGDAGAYLDSERIIRIAREQGCDAVHPGYGFLSENPAFARKCAEAGLIFVGPPWEAIEAMGHKSRSKDIMTAAGVPCIPGYHGEDQDPVRLKNEADGMGYPVLLKAVKGGGGKGMRIVREPAEFDDQLRSAMTEARNSFGDDVMLVERYITTPRHIEVQVFADKYGNCVALGERDCSIQRRHQKILEESPAPHLPDEIRQDIWSKARAAALAVGYEGAGTVEFIFDNDTNEFFFMEMNTRLQVEHPVSEMVTGEDLVRWQLIVASGGKLPLTQEEIEARIKSLGHAVEARIYAENPDMNFIPDSGALTHLRAPPLSPTVRLDAGFVAGDMISAHYDPMIAKLIVRGETRDMALQKLRAALEAYEIGGPVTNIEFLKRVSVSPDFVAGHVETGFIDKHREELFRPVCPGEEVFVQAAIGLLLIERDVPVSAVVGREELLGAPYRERSVTLVPVTPVNQPAVQPTCVSLREVTPLKLIASVNDKTFECSFSAESSSASSPAARTFSTFFPHTRLTTTLLFTDDTLTLWQKGQQHRLRLVPPAWVASALGARAGDAASSVVAPMPCKVLRLEVRAGERVEKGQMLAVVESMKMEMVIRAPASGVVGRVVHGAGDMCKAGTALVEFEEEEEEEEEEGRRGEGKTA